MCPEGEEDGAQRQLPIEAETESDTDGESSYASDVSETTSTTSSVRNYVYENGRRYHSYRSGQYLLPNDETEQDRLDIIHHVFSLTLDGAVCRTKLENPQAILDIGTGTGIWAIDMGDLYPSAEVIGTDLSPIQPEWVPPNVVFQVDDATQPWTFPEDKFDLIHARTLAGAIQDWPALVAQCYTHCKPGGAVEISEGRANFFCDDGSLPPSSKTHEWLAEFRHLSAPLGFDVAPELPALLRAGGFEDVEFVQRHVPLGTWPRDPKLKEIGRFFRVQFLERALEAYSLALFTRFGSWTSEEVQVLLALVREELKSNRFHLYTYSAFATGRKPLKEKEVEAA